MKIERAKNASRNAIFGFILKIYSLVLPFVIRTAMIYLMGVEYLGLNSLFTSVLQVLNLAELGVGSAMVFSMYKPIAVDDKVRICALMKLYRLYYRIIGLVVLVGGILVLPFIPKLIKSDVPVDVNVYTLYLLNLCTTVLTYWLFAYRNSLFQAHQRTDIISKITLFTDTIKYVIQLVVLCFFKNYYYYVIAILFTQVLNNILIALNSKRMFPQYMPDGEVLPEERKAINQRIKDLFTSKLGGTILNSADTLVISACLGLRVLAIYQNYFYIVSALQGIVTIIFASVIAGSGNSMVTETKEKNYADFRKITWITFWIIGFAVCGMVCVYQPLMRVWVKDELMLPYGYVIFFCLYFVGVMTVQLLSVYKDAAGIWHQDRFRPLISGVINLILNLVLVNFIGLYGILLSTIISVYFISIPWIFYNVFYSIFQGKLKYYIKDIGRYSVVIIVCTVITAFICELIPNKGMISLVIKMIVCTIVCNMLFLMIYRKTKIFQEIKVTFLGMIRK